MNPLTTYQNTVGKSPVLDAGVRAIAAGGGAYVFKKYIFDKVLEKFGPVVGEGKLRKAWASPEGKKRLTKLFVGGSALLAGAPPLIGNYSSRRGAKDNLKALTLGRDKKQIEEDATHAYNNPENLELNLFEIPNRPTYRRDMDVNKGPAARKITDMFKKASYGAGSWADIRDTPINYNSSLATLHKDPLLSTDDADKLIAMMNASKTDEHNWTAAKFAQKAVHFGAGAVPGYMAGKFLGTVFGAEEESRDTVARVGAIAAGIANTGVFRNF